MASVITNPVTNTNYDRSKRKKKKKQMVKENQQSQNQNHARWKSEAQQQIYSSKLIQALSRVSLNSPPPAPRGGRAVREAADRALAVAAKGRTRWSRAILTSRLKLKFRKQKRQRGSAAVVAAVTRSRRSKKPRVSVLKLKAKSLSTVQRKVKVLGRLVPGCRKQPLPVVLEEATDYIAALEMQVRAMSALAELMSGSGATSSSSAPPPQSPPPTSH
ncbi:transcription factor bHLH148-like [Durio zibethinus]|uniref:Transcription factor bHLH148-like n=1 Tax=Durio zibethinus TaxID=66656 RepID=A0A6P5Z9G0_DURZI|nr:transcription factor bHLH148-like [Durio zibethinus]XP_022749062.1 transcription factor bHLH148-like [Durio zibethinus]